MKTTFTKSVFETELQWLESRTGITGTLAAAVIGESPDINTEQADKRIKGLEQAQDSSKNELVQYGRKAEKHLAELFRLDYPQYEIETHDNWLLTNTEYQYMQYSPDGLISIKGKEGKATHGILEIKTVNNKKWQEGIIPNHYYIQVLHGLLVTGYDFVVLKSQHRYDYDGNVRCETYHAHINRAEVQDDIDYLRQQEIEFWEKYIKTDTPPPLKIKI